MENVTIERMTNFPVETGKKVSFMRPSG